MVKSSVDRFGRPVARAGTLEVGERVGGALLQGPPQGDDLGVCGGYAHSNAVDELDHELAALRTIGFCEEPFERVDGQGPTPEIGDPDEELLARFVAAERSSVVVCGTVRASIGGMRRFLTSAGYLDPQERSRSARAGLGRGAMHREFAWLLDFLGQPGRDIARARNDHA